MTTDLNASMRRIDLFCKLIGPLFISFVDSYSTRVAIWTIFGLNMASVLIEYLAIAQVYRSVPALKRTTTILRRDDTDAAAATRVQPRQCQSFVNHLREASEPWREYVASPVFLASFALSLLYLTVLSFGATMVTYLLESGFSSLEVPQARGSGRSGPRRRTGCLTCRARKVRCDEAKPSCANCDRLRLRCVYRPPIALGSWASSRRSVESTAAHAHRVTQTAPTPAMGPASAAAAVAAVSQRSPDLNFFGTVLRSDNHHRTIPAPTSPMRRLPGDAESYPSELGGPV
ncbi:Major facilitator superfamily domain general substrate transporter [Penicillium atrosanguineum]|nr:Major facilitator superfamily domain general substrate transporter [Penicillium atrosanguineum]